MGCKQHPVPDQTLFKRPFCTWNIFGRVYFWQWCSQIQRIFGNIHQHIKILSWLSSSPKNAKPTQYAIACAIQLQEWTWQPEHIFILPQSWSTTPPEVCNHSEHITQCIARVCDHSVRAHNTLCNHRTDVLAKHSGFKAQKSHQTLCEQRSLPDIECIRRLTENGWVCFYKEVLGKEKMLARRYCYLEIFHSWHCLIH